MLNTVILMAGRGSRFSDLDSSRPKPLVPLHGRPLVHWVVQNIRTALPQKFIFVCQTSHIKEFQLHRVFESFKVDFEIAPVNGITKGAACSALLAEGLANSGEVVFANSDQYVDFSMDLFIKDCHNRNLDGSLVTMNASGTKWSYVRTDVDNLVVEVKEKIPISNIATTGIYYFKTWDTFSDAAQMMISKNDTYNNEFYMAPVYNYVSGNGKVSHYHIGENGKEMIGLGTKEDFQDFVNDPRSLKIKEKLF